MTLDQLTARCRFWQELLRLQDWDVKILVVRRFALSRGVAMAEIDIYRRATIKMLDPVDIDPDGWTVDSDMEVSLVHELLHLSFHDMGRPKTDSPEDIACERAVEATANAIVALSRRGTS